MTLNCKTTTQKWRRLRRPPRRPPPAAAVGAGATCGVAIAGAAPPAGDGLPQKQQNANKKWPMENIRAAGEVKPPEADQTKLQ